MSQIRKEDEKPMSVVQSAIYWPWELKERTIQLTGPAVVFDVMAATYNMIFIVQRAKELYVTTKTGVKAAIKSLPDAVLIGEVDDPVLYDELKDVFISSNSPASIQKADVANKRVILISNNGTHAASEVLDAGASSVRVGHYANFFAVVDQLRLDGREVTLVPSGGSEAIFAANPKLIEDSLCARSMQRALKGERIDLPSDFERIRREMNLYYGSHMPTSADMDVVFQENTFSIVPWCERVDEALIRVQRA